MTFEESLKLMDKGEKIRYEEWGEGEECGADDEFTYICKENGKLRLKNEKTGYDDLLYIDFSPNMEGWEVYEMKNPPSK